MDTLIVMRRPPGKLKYAGMKCSPSGTSKYATLRFVSTEQISEIGRHQISFMADFFSGRGEDPHAIIGLSAGIVRHTVDLLAEKFNRLAHKPANIVRIHESTGYKFCVDGDTHAYPLPGILEVYWQERGVLLFVGKRGQIIDLSNSISGQPTDIGYGHALVYTTRPGSKGFAPGNLILEDIIQPRPK